MSAKVFFKKSDSRILRFYSSFWFCNHFENWKSGCGAMNQTDHQVNIVNIFKHPLQKLYGIWVLLKLKAASHMYLPVL